MKISLQVCALLLVAVMAAGDSLAKNGLAIPIGVETPVIQDSYEDIEPDEQFLATGEKPRVSISSISPAHGPVAGDTRVVVRGGPFAGYQTAYPAPKCRFGTDEAVVPATYVRCPEEARRIYEREAAKEERTAICLACEGSPPTN